MADFKQITVAGVSHPVKDEVARQGLAGKQDKLTFDDTPTANSNNPVKSGGVYQAIQDIDVSSQISGKADKSEMSVMPGTGANADKTTITLKSGTSATVLTQHQDVSEFLKEGEVFGEGDDSTASFNSYSDTVWNKQQTLSESQKQQIRDNIGVSIADNEDIQSVNGILKFADRAYTATTSSVQGNMGYKILRKGSTFASQVTAANTIYEIRYDYDLNDTSVSIPENCVLKFEGGSIDGGTIVLNNCGINSIKACFGENLTIVGKTLQEASPEWFVGSDADKIEKAIDIFGSVRLSPRTYEIERQIKIHKSFRLTGNAIPDCFLNTQYNPNSVTSTELKATTNIDSILLVEENNNIGYYSIVIEGVYFSTDTAVRYNVNGINIITPGGPTRPVEIKNCNFQYLNYGIYITGSIYGKSTNVGNLHIHDNNITRCGWGIYAEGRHALIVTTINDNVIENNTQGGIYIYDDTIYEETSDEYFPSYGNLEIRNNILEGNPCITIKSDGFIILAGNYFENTGSVNIIGKYHTRLKIFNNQLPASGISMTYNIEKCTIQEFSDYCISGKHYTTSFERCIFLTAPLVNIDSITDCYVCYDDFAGEKSVPTKVVGVPKNHKYNSKYCMYSSNGNSYINYSAGSISEGKYRIIYYCSTIDNIPHLKLRVNGNNYGSTFVSHYQYIPHEYKNGFKYVSDITLPEGANYAILIYYRGFNNAVSDLFLYAFDSNDSFTYIPSAELTESTGISYIDKSSEEIEVNKQYNTISEASIGESYTIPSAVSNNISDCIILTLVRNEVIEINGVVQMLVLDSNNIVTDKILDNSSYIPYTHIIKAIETGYQVIVNLYNSNYPNNKPYGNVAGIPYSIKRVYSY